LYTYKSSILDVEKKTMEKIRISAVKYANTYPFIFGLTQSGFDKKVILETDHPADCAAKLLDGRADIGLIPAGALPLLKEYHIISDYCIGANGNVRTVRLFSNTEPEKIHTIYLDYHSRTSVNLIKVLARDYWKQNFRWVDTQKGFDFQGIGEGEAMVIIGDRCFEFENMFSYKPDLASLWKEHTGLPFVFACWVSNKALDPGFLREFNEALLTGINNIDGVVARFGPSAAVGSAELKDYLTHNIDYDFNNDKRKALNLFLGLMSSL
jgi:chorismate dehydratase